MITLNLIWPGKNITFINCKLVFGILKGLYNRHVELKRSKSFFLNRPNRFSITEYVCHQCNVSSFNA